MNYNEIVKNLADSDTTDYDLIDHALKRLEVLNAINYDGLIENQIIGINLQIHDIQNILEAYLQRHENQ